MSDGLGRHSERIEYDNVTFGHESEETVLDGVDFAVESGETVALVGATGARQIDGRQTVASAVRRRRERSSRPPIRIAQRF